MLAALSLCLLASAGCTDSPAPQGDLSRDLVLQDTRDDRPWKGRVWGRFPHRPFSSEPQPFPLELQAAKLDLATSTEGLPVAQVAFRRGRASLLETDLRRAINELEAAVAHAPEDAGSWNDLAVAYLTRHVVDDRAWDLVEALDAALEAIELAPESVETRFNYALCLSLFSLRRQAKTAWEEYFELEDDADWLAEAQTFYADATRPRPADLFEAEKERLEALATPGAITVFDEALHADVERVVDDYPFLARLWLEEDLFGQWARAARDGRPNADALLDLAESAARGLAQARGDPLPKDVVKALRDAESDPDRLAALVEAHVEFASAMESYRRQEFGSVEETLGRAEEVFRRYGSPMELWARFYRLVCLHYRESELAEAEFLKLQRQASSQDYWSLSGLCQWMAGLCLGLRTTGSDLEIQRYESAADVLDQMADGLGAAPVKMLIATTLDALGDVEGSWKQRLKSLVVLGSSGLHRQEHNVWYDASQALMRSSRHALADVVLRELVANAQEWETHSYALAEARSQLAWNLLESGRFTEARAQLLASRGALARLEDPERIGLRLRAFLDIYEGMSLVESDPARALVLLERSLPQLDEQDLYFERPRFLAAMAQAQRRLGDLPAAEHVLRNALEFWEETRSGVSEFDLSLMASRSSQPVMEELVSLLQESGRFAEAFEIADWSKARSLSSGQRSMPNWTSATIEEMRAVLETDTVLVEYFLAGESVFGWVLNRNSLRSVRLPIDRRELRERMAILKKDLSRQADDSVVVPQLRGLYEAVVEPLDLPSAESLVVVPDMFLASLPFEALPVSGASGDWLLDHYEITLTPSASAISRRPRETSSTVAQTVVVVVQSGSSSEGSGSMEGAELESSRLEAESLLDIYPDATVKVDGTLTRKSLVELMKKVTVFHFAGHAEANSFDPGRSRLWLNSELGGSEEYLGLSELWAADLEGLELVVLSACETGVGGDDSRDAIFGLAGGFLSAGVDKVVASRWPVADDATARFMKRFHGTYSMTRDSHRALRDAMVAMRTSDHPVSAWAAFQLIGRTTPAN